MQETYDDTDLRWSSLPHRVQVGPQFRTLDFLPLDDLLLWLLDLQERRVGTEVQQRIAYIEDYLIDSVRSAFAELTGLPIGDSR